jgi:hypothetical protein
MKKEGRKGKKCNREKGVRVIKKMRRKKVRGTGKLKGRGRRRRSI